MKWPFLLIVVGVPLLTQLAAVFAVTPKRQRSMDPPLPSRDERPTTSDAALLAAVLLLAWADRREPYALLFVLVAAYCIFAARFLTSALHDTMAAIETNYLDFRAWSAAEQKGSRWRYEMKHRFIRRPEFVDDLTLDLVKRHKHYASFLAALREGRTPGRFEEHLHEKAWGVGMPTLHTLATRTLPEEVFEGRGRRSRSMSGAEVFRELKTLTADRMAFLDRLQYHWTLRNLDYIEGTVASVVGLKPQVVAVAVISTVWLICAATLDHASLQQAGIRSLAGGTIFWLGIVGGGVCSVFMALFRGTGTFSIDYPCSDHRYDRVWNSFTRLGVVAFFMTFFGYGVCLPLLLEPSALGTGLVSPGLAIVSSAGLTYCAALFANHMFGTHILMVEAKENALGRLTDEIRDETDSARRSLLLEQFREIRGLRVWPLDEIMAPQVLLGVAGPIVAQIAIVFFHLN